MAFEVPKAANDNFSPEELLQQRRGELETSSATIREVRDWIKQRREENNLVASDLGEISGARREEIYAALDALEIALAETENAFNAAEEQLDSLEAFGLAKASASRLSIALVEAEGVIDEE